MPKRQHDGTRGRSPMVDATLGRDDPRRPGVAFVILLTALTMAVSSCGDRKGRGVGVAGAGRTVPAGLEVPERLYLFAGAASQPATQEAVRLYTRQTGIDVACTFGGSGAVLNQVSIERFGDVYLPGSDDYMDIAEREGHVLADTRRPLCYLLPCICVPKGNPRAISGLSDLASAEVKIAIGDPASVCLGTIAKEALESRGMYASVQKQIVTYASDCQQVVNLVRLGEVDAAVGYDVFARQSPDLVEVIPLAGVRSVRVPAAVITYSKYPEAARNLVDFLASDVAKAIFADHGYTVTIN